MSSKQDSANKQKAGQREIKVGEVIQEGSFAGMVRFECGYFSICEICCRLGEPGKPCKQCEGPTQFLCDYDSDSPDFKGVDPQRYQMCLSCDYVEKIEDDEAEVDFKKLCFKCMQSGIKSKMAFPGFGDKKMLIKQKSHPRCALLFKNCCSECNETATYFEKQLPRTIMMASSIIRVVREYEALVHVGFKVNLGKEQEVKTRLLFEPTSLDISPKKLATLIEHHHKMCLCSICKFWIISDIQQTEL